MFTRIKLTTFILIGMFLLTGCQEDLFPSNDQLTSKSEAQVGALIDDLEFTLSTNINDEISSRLQPNNIDAVVLYFTMWCPVCDSHMSHIRSQFKNQYPNIEFMFVDYVSGSTTSSRGAQTSSGYSDFDVISDYDNALENYFSGTMASTIVIDKNFIVLMNEEFKTGSQLASILDNL
jgi:peroxiredoxin